MGGGGIFAGRVGSPRGLAAVLNPMTVSTGGALLWDRQGIRSLVSRQGGAGERLDQTPRAAF